jgi:two-component system response regulator
MSQSNFHILLIDDSEADARIFEKALQEAAPRAKLYWVATGHEAIEYLHQQNRFQNVGPVSLVVSDLNMPGMSGFDLLAQVKKSLALKFIPFVIYSASSSPKDIADCYSLGANSYLKKPLTLDSTLEQVKALVYYWLDLVKLPEPGHFD